MATQPLLTEAVQKSIGLQGEPVVIEVDKTLISRFASAVGDTNPLWCDEAKAAKGPYGRLIAPPSLLNTGLFAGNSPALQILDQLPPRKLDGGGEYEFFLPIELGDQLTVNSKIADIVERQGRMGSMLILTTETTWRNQRNELVAKALTNLIMY